MINNMTVKHEGCLSSSILIEECGKQTAIKNTDENWIKLGRLHANGVSVMFEEQHGFWTMGYGYDHMVDIRVIPVTDSVPYLFRTGRKSEANARLAEIMADVRKATKAAGFQS